MKGRAKELFEEVTRIMAESDVNLMELSRASGIGYTTLRMMRKGEGNPTVDMLDKVYSSMFSRIDGELSCEACKWCMAFEPETPHYACELAMAGGDDWRACVMYSPFVGDDGDAA